MGAATITPTEWGYYVTGDTDPTYVWVDGRKYVKDVTFVAGAANANGLLKSVHKPDDGDAAGAVATLTGNSWDELFVATSGDDNHHYYGEPGSPADNMVVKLENAGDKFYIRLRSA